MVWTETNAFITSPAVFSISRLTPRPIHALTCLIAWDVIDATTGWAWLA